MEILNYCYIKPLDLCYIKPPPASGVLLVMLLPFEMRILYHISYFAVTYFICSDDYAGVLLNIKYKQFYMLLDQFLENLQTSARRNVFSAVRIHWQIIPTIENSSSALTFFKILPSFSCSLPHDSAEVTKPYVYWTVHNLDSWIKRDQLDITCLFISLFNAQHVSDVNTSILRRLRLICCVI